MSPLDPGAHQQPAVPLDGTVTVAAVQVTPVFLDREATTDLLVGLVDKAASEGAQLVVFPEAILPGYPDWVWRAPAWSDGALYDRLFDQAVDVPGPALDTLGRAARAAGVWVAVGVTERVPSGTLYNTLVYLDPAGRVAGRHRKLMPTGGERTVWGQGDGTDLTVLDTGFARVGGLVCWENLMPLARAALYQQGVDVYLAPTWDNHDTWLSTLRHIAREGRCFVIGTNTCLRAGDLPASLPRRDLFGEPDDWLSQGNTAIIGPEGEVVAGPLRGEAGMLVATLDLRRLRRARRQFDVAGHYARPDVLRLEGPVLRGRGSSTVGVAGPVGG